MTSITADTDFYVLKIYFDPNIIDEEVLNKYKSKIQVIQKKIEELKDIETGELNEFDAGFDLFVPQSWVINKKALSNKVDHGICCSMTFKNKPTAYYLYPRSSMGFKTPLRLSNSVGIIDSGYRGHIVGLVDNISDSDYNINKNDRLMQICPPNIMYPIYPEIVSNIHLLGPSIRGSAGFGSTGV